MTPENQPAKTDTERIPISPEETDKLFQQVIAGHLRRVEEIGSVDIVVGIPFYNEVHTIASVVQTVREGLEEYYPEQKAIIAAVGSPLGDECLQALANIPQDENIKHVSFLLRDLRLSGKGWAVRAAMEIAAAADADLIILESDLTGVERNGEIEGFSPDWIHLLLEPIKAKNMDLVISRFNRHHLESPISSQLIYPLMAAIYNCPVYDVLGGQWGISHHLVDAYLKESFARQGTEVGGYGIDIWLATKAASLKVNICEANLGLKVHGATGKMELMLHHSVQTLFERIIADRENWEQDGESNMVPMLDRLPVFGTPRVDQPAPVVLNIPKLESNFRREFDTFRGLYSSILPDDTYVDLEELSATGNQDFSVPAGVWVKTVYHFLFSFAFNKEFARGDLIGALVPLFEGRLAGFAIEAQSQIKTLKGLPRDEADRLAALQAEDKIEKLVDEFLLQRQDFLAEWEKEEEELKPPVPKVTYREFIPGVHLVVPLEVTAPQGKTVTANGVYDSLFLRYHEEFEEYIHEKLKLPRESSSQTIIQGINTFMNKIEALLDIVYLPGNLSTVKGTRQVVEKIFSHFHRDEAFLLDPEVARQIILKNPPTSLLTRLGFRDLPVFTGSYGPSELLALASTFEETEYQESVLRQVRRNFMPAHLQPSELKPVVVNHEDFPALAEMREVGSLCKLTGKVVVSNLRKGTGGKFPKIRYFTTIAKTIIEMERFCKIWRGWAKEKRDLGEKVVNSLEGHWGIRPLSAHNVFENGHQRVFVRRIKELAQNIVENTGDSPDDTKERMSLAENLRILADSYHLVQTLSDGKFVSCSAWSWASYSFKGGMGLPTPLSLHVERDWTSADFLGEYLKQLDREPEDIDNQIIDLMGQGRESADLAPILLGTTRDADAIVQVEMVPNQQPPAGTLERYERNPVLEPVRNNGWEQLYVLNPGAIGIDGKVYLVYRAFGEDKVSRLGLAVSEDGFNFSQRLDQPIFQPANRHEEKGCEDARLTRIGERIYMLYTAYNGTVAQIGMASIGIQDFIDFKWSAWRRHGMVFPGFTNKDGMLFPEKFDGKYAMLHRVDPHIWITFSPHLRCPWPRKEHKILAGATYGMLWDGKKIGGGTQPLKTRYGWLMITHGVDHLRVYRLGVLLLRLDDPTMVLYRSPNAVLEPEESYEEGEPGRDWVPNVVFTCGAVPRQNNKPVLDVEDELLVYYGAADSVIGVATAKVGDLIPAEFTGKLSD
ncbi:MAG: glycosidase [Dehalococcoidia bacterium]